MTSETRIGVGPRLFLTAAPDLPIGSELSPGHWLPHVEKMVVARQSAETGLSWDPNTTHVLLELAFETIPLREFLVLVHEGEQSEVSAGFNDLPFTMGKPATSAS